MTEREKERAFPGPSVSDVPEERRNKGMKGGACNLCRGERYIGCTVPCPACHGTGRKETSDGD